MPDAPAAAPAAATNTPLLKSLKAVALIGDRGKIEAKGMNLSPGIHCIALSPPGAASLEPVFKPYLGHPVSLVSINALTRDLILFYRAHDRPFVDISTPAQDISNGVLQLLVVESRLGHVRAQGNRWFRSSLLESGIRAQPGSAISAKAMQQDIDRLNTNPFRQVDALYTPGDEFGTTDIILRTQDHFPVRVFAGYENTGVETDGPDRWLAGFNWGNAFGLDHDLSYQATVSTDFRLSRSQAVTYTAPLPWRHTLTLFGAYSDSEGEFLNAGQTFLAGGRSVQAGIRYTVPLPALAAFTHDLFFGFDFKRTNNNLAFGEEQVFDTDTDVLQFVTGYDASSSDAWGTATLNSTLFYSPGGLDGDNSETAFQQSRALSRSRYVYGHIAFTRLVRLPRNSSLVIRASGQWADANLLPSEQLGVGGYDSVRGYDERAVNADEGTLFSTELRAPPFPLLRHKDQLQLLGFFDYGRAQLKRPLPDEPNNIALASVGLGLRYTIDPYLSLRFDYGWQLEKIPAETNEHGRAHIGVVVSY